MRNDILEEIEKNYLLEYKEKEEKSSQKRIIFGFWLYLLSDLISFSVLFSAYSIFKYFSEKKIFFHFELLTVFFESICLLFSSFTCSRALTYFEYNKSFRKVILWLTLTFFLGSIFLLIEIFEIYFFLLKNFFIFNAICSSYLCLIGFHFLHVCIGLIWIVLLIIHLKSINIDRLSIQTRLKCFSLFWHFLDIIWICIFTIVYLIGNIS